MKYTSAEANKLLKELRKSREVCAALEERTKFFTAATVENVEDVRPEYDYEGTAEKLAEYDRQIRKVKHALNVFNATTQVPGFGMTIDEMLVYLPQLQARLDSLCQMAVAQQKERVTGYGNNGNFIEYRYANYDVKKALADYMSLNARRLEAQAALDRVNGTRKMEIDL